MIILWLILGGWNGLWICKRGWTLISGTERKEDISLLLPMTEASFWGKSTLANHFNQSLIIFDKVEGRPRRRWAGCKLRRHLESVEILLHFGFEGDEGEGWRNLQMFRRKIGKGKQKMRQIRSKTCRKSALLSKIQLRS